MQPLHRPLLIALLAAALGSPVAAQYQEAHKLDASDIQSYDEFGSAVAVDGDLALVGSPYEDTKGQEAGAAYVFDLTTGVERHKLTAWDTQNKDNFGYAVALSGTLAVVAAPEHDKWRGRVYVFDALTGQELFHLTASDGKVNDRFGDSLDADGDRLIVGSPLHGSMNTGAAYVFDLTTGQEVVKLLAPNPGDYDFMGVSVAIHGNRALVGGSVSDNPETDRGKAWLFDATGGVPLHELVAADGGANHRFGAAVALDGTRALVGAPGHSGWRGRAYLFDAGNGQQLAALDPLDAEDGDAFGTAVALDGGRAVIGARASDDAGGQAGSAYVFDLASGLQVAKLLASDGESGDYFGEALDADGGRVVVGAPNEDDPGILSGAAYAFEALGCTVTHACSPAVPNSTGNPGVIDALSCSASQGAQLVGRDLPPDQFGYLLVGQGAGVVQPPGSVGDLCLAGAPIGRYAPDVASSGAAGRITTDLVFGVVGGGAGDLPTPPGGALAAGQTWGFQYWYRDAPTSNSTDLVRVVFQP